MKVVDGKSVYTVSEVNSITRQTLEQINFWVEGELSSFRGYDTRYRYIYFDLKDPKTNFKLPCILEPEIFLSQDSKLADGKMVLILGSLSLWEKEARLQMHVLKLEEYGEGFLLAEFEKLKTKLEHLGYFNQDRKKNIPAYPTNIAVITSRVSDAWHDFKKHSLERFSPVEATLFDVSVQGEKATAQIASALKKADKMNFEVVVLIRGGGSHDDLSAFNNENLANIIFKAKTPIIVGVGHEKDITIASLVADVSASTPTDAAKIITENFIKLDQKLKEHQIRASRAYKNKLLSTLQDLDMFLNKLISIKEKYRYLPDKLNTLKASLVSSANKITNYNQMNLKKHKSTLSIVLRNLYTKNELVLKNYHHKLMLVTPENILKRGYSITTNLKGIIIKDAAATVAGEKIRVKLAKGILSTKIITKEY